MGHIRFQSRHAVQGVLPGLGRQHLDALGNQDRRFSFHLNAVLQIFNGLDAVDQGLTAVCQRLSRQSRTRFGGIALPSLGLLNVKRCLGQQLFCFVSPNLLHVIGRLGGIVGDVVGVHKRSNRSVEDGRAQAKVAIVAAAKPI